MLQLDYKILLNEYGRQKPHGTMCRTNLQLINPSRRTSSLKAMGPEYFLCRGRWAILPTRIRIARIVIKKLIQYILRDNIFSSNVKVSHVKMLSFPEFLLHVEETFYCDLVIYWASAHQELGILFRLLIYYNSFFSTDVELAPYDSVAYF